MNIDTTTSTGVTRISSASNTTNRVPNNVVPITQRNSNQVDRPDEQVTAEQQQLTSEEDVRQAVDSVNNFVQQTNRNLEFAVEESSGRVVITVREAETGNIIRQIPPEEVLAIAELINNNLQNTATPVGVLIADKV